MTLKNELKKFFTFLLLFFFQYRIINAAIVSTRNPKNANKGTEFFSVPVSPTLIFYHDRAYIHEEYCMYSFNKKIKKKQKEIDRLIIIIMTYKTYIISIFL